MMLSGKQALVTGAGQGIGKGCALELAKAGANVVINDRPGSKDVEETADEIRALGRSCTVITANIFQRDECERLLAQAVEALGQLDILVSNPAASIRCGFLDLKAEDFEFVINGALTSGFHMSQLAARHMVENGGGKIVFISSVHAHLPYALGTAYNTAKAGLNHMARTIATELAKHRINVNVIEPGWIDTPGERKTFGEQRMLEEAANMPWGRLGVPEDIGKAAAFLASDNADYITGSVLRVDGGIVLKDCRADTLINSPE